MVHRVGILDFPASVGGEEITLLAVQTLDSSKLSSQSAQWSDLALRMASAYRLHCMRYSS